ncbi:hypothetical protein BDFB_015149 [Asbolus verrucosus]|uniref:Uncharacterized protein n=1 Tax=Asbolus verrucosus TaxID=1661398 RepID=A0A482W9I8_ASBVE|nr:hypothetical protein BDFB_015149 [Asbolus verrucosus]
MIGCYSETSQHLPQNTRYMVNSCHSIPGHMWLLPNHIPIHIG